MFADFEYSEQFLVMSDVRNSYVHSAEEFSGMHTQSYRFKCIVEHLLEFHLWAGTKYESIKEVDEADEPADWTRGAAERHRATEAGTETPPGIEGAETTR